MWLIRLLKEAIDGDPIPDPPKFDGEVQGKIAAAAIRDARAHSVRAAALEGELLACGYSEAMIDDVVSKYVQKLRTAAQLRH